MNWFTKLFSHKNAPPSVFADPTYAFCENVAAGSASPWHIRRLTEKGKKLGGGVDTMALCGHVVHWDRQFSVSRVACIALSDGETCHKCSAIYMALD